MIIFSIVIAFAELIKYYFIFIIHSNNTVQHSELSNSIIYSIVFFISRVIVFVLPGEDTLLSLIIGIRGVSYILTDSLVGLTISILIAFITMYLMMRWKTKINNKYGKLSVLKYYLVLGLIVFLQIV